MTVVVEEFQSIAVGPQRLRLLPRGLLFAVKTEATASKEPREPQTTAAEFTSEGQTLATEIVKEPVTIGIARKSRSPQQRVRKLRPVQRMLWRKQGVQ